MFKISASEFCTVGMYRQIQACEDEFLATVTEGVVYSVYKVVIWSSFCVTWRHKVTGGKWTFHQCVSRSHMNLGQGHFTKHL